MLWQIAGLRHVAFEIIKHHTFANSRKPHKLKVMWWVVGSRREPRCMNIKQNVNLTNEQWATRTLWKQP